MNFLVSFETFLSLVHICCKLSNINDQLSWNKINKTFLTVLTHKAKRWTLWKNEEEL